VISRPIVKADMRIIGFDESVIKNEIITVVTEFGDCLACVPVPIYEERSQHDLGTVMFV